MSAGRSDSFRNLRPAVRRFVAVLGSLALFVGSATALRADSGFSYTLVSGAAPNTVSWGFGDNIAVPSINANGTFVLYRTSTMDSNACFCAYDLIRANLVTGEKQKVNVDSQGNTTDGFIRSAAMSRDGHWIAWGTLNLADFTGMLYARNLVTGAFYLDQLPREAYVEDISNTGLAVLDDTGNALVPNQIPWSNGFLWQPQTNQLTQVPPPATVNGFQSAIAGQEATISADGSEVAFTDAEKQIAVYNTVDESYDLFPKAANGGLPDGFTELPVISPSGRYVAFYSTALNLSPSAHGVSSLYLFDRQTRQVSVVPNGRWATPGAFSDDERYIGYMDENRDFVDWDRQTGAVTTMADVGQYGFEYAGNARRFVFWAPDLGVADTNDYYDVYVTPALRTADSIPPVTTDDAPSGWENYDVTVHLTATDDSSGVAATYNTVDGGAQQQGTSILVAAPADHSNDGVHQITYSSVDSAGNAESPHVATVNIDTAGPVITWTGDLGIYTVDQTVAITCGASDTLSGVATSSCTPASGPAWWFGLGTTTLSGTATDFAGNTANASSSFTVAVTCASVDRLVLQFFGGHQNGAEGLTEKVAAICAAPNANAKAGALRAFNNQVDAKLGNPLTAAQAKLLKTLAAGL